MHTDQYKLCLRTLSEGDHEYSWLLEDKYFQSFEANGIEGGEVEVHLHLHRMGSIFNLTFSSNGVVDTTCDRCLDPMEIDIEAERELIVKFGSEYREESDEILVIPEQDGVLDLEWLLYEDVVLSLPMQRLHDEGDCNEEMMEIIHGVQSEEVDGTAQDAGEDEEESMIDERWAALKELKRD